MYPLKFEPILKQTLWGGDKIIPFKHLNDTLANVGESWEVSAVEGSESIVSNGADKGLTLPEMVRKYKEDLVGEANYARFGNKFPLLIKFIDAKLDLSIQVHPGDELAKKRHNSFGKNEMWYVIAADKGAKLISGFSEQITPKEYKERVYNGTFAEVLQTCAIKPGDVFYVPAGRVHGIGAGAFVAEIQQTSDITYRIFSYTPLTADKATRGKVGIPRVLNMFENYPFWYTFFTELKYEVVLSPTSTRKIYELGIESIPSESECYPAKLAHGHVTWLIRNGVKFIFYPCIPYERNEFPDAVNHYNCPIVTSYAENIKNNVDELNDPSITFRNPFLAFTSEEILANRLIEEFKDIPAEEIKAAVHKGWEEMAAARRDVQKKGEETLKYLEETGRHGIVLAGRPYHIDPEIHHGIPDLINSYGIAVLTEDSISHLAPVERPIRVNDQWKVGGQAVLGRQ